VPAIERIDAMYRGEMRLPDGAVVHPPWEIGEPQPVVLALEESGQVRGRVLDAGCGSGEHVVYLAERGYPVVGVDASVAAIELAREKVRQRGVSADLVLGDAVELDGYTDVFDTVLDVGLFHGLTPEQQHRYATALHRACRPDAVVHILCFSGQVSPEALRAAFGTGWDLPEPGPSTLVGRVSDQRMATEWFQTVAGPDGRVEIPAWLASPRRG
jgi:SAM-dependent methyltransferase